MNKEKKQKKILVLLLLLLLLIGVVVGIFLVLNKKDKSETEEVYQITILDSAHGSVTANQYEAKEGDEIVLTVTPDDGYELSSLTVNGEKSETSFEMPAEDVKVLAKFALIVTGEEDADEGETFGSSNGYVTTEGVDLSHDNGDNPYISMVAGGPQYAYVNDVYTDQLVFEAIFKVKEIFNEDGYPKFGIMINGTTEMVKFYVDMKTDLTCESVGVVHQPTGGEDDWTNACTASISKLNLAEEDITLKLVRDGENYYFYVNGVLILCEKGALCDENTAVGIFSFNTGMDVYDYSHLEDSAAKSEIAQAKKDSYSLVGDFFGKSGSYTSSDVIDFSTDHGSNPSLVLDANKGTPLYTFINDFTSKQFYFETEVKVSDILSNENYPKFGLLVQDSKEMVKFYLDMNQEKQVAQVGVVHQLTGKEDDWANQSTALFSKKLDLSKDTVKLSLLRNGTAYYFYVNDELIMSGNDLTSQSGVAGVFSFGTTLTLTNYKLVKSGSEYEALLTQARAEAELLDTFKLTQNYFTMTENGVYKLTTDSADESKVDDVMLSGSILKTSYYSITGKLTLSATEDWSQARILISSDANNEYVIALEQTGENEYQIFTMSKDNEDSWNDWRLISSSALNGDRNSIDFEVIVNGDEIYFLIDDEICYTSDRVDMTESTVKFSSYKNATTTVENLDGQLFDSQKAVEEYLATKSEKAYETEYETRINELYKEYITTNGCAGQGGTLLLGHSHIDFWDAWETQTGLTNYVNGYNVGIGGTTTKDWLYAYDKLIKPFAADRFVISVGENDVTVWGEDGEDVVERLKELFEKIHTDFPDAEIYYIYSLPSPTKYVNGAYVNAKYAALVTGEKVLCESLDYVQGVDTFDVLATADKKNANVDLFLADNVHLNAAGYQAWSDYLYDVIFKGETFGVTIADGTYYKTTNGIELINDTGDDATIEMFGGSPRYAYLNETYTDTLCFEAEFNVTDVLNNDSWPKFGLLLSGASEMVKFYVDMTPQMTAASVGIVHQKTGEGDDWTNAVSANVSNMSFTGNDKIKLAIVRDGTNCYFYVNDELVLWERDGLYDEETTAGIFSFNTVLTASDYQILKDETATSYVAQAIADAGFFGNVKSYATSTGVDLSKDTGANTGTVSVTAAGSMFAYVENFYESEFYFETKIHVNEIFANEAWPKFGLFVEDGSLRVSFYVDMTTSKTATQVGRVNATDGYYDWGTSTSVSVSGMSFSGNGEYITLGVLKDGKYLYFFVDGQYVMSYESSLEGDVVAGVFGFNTGMELKEYYIDQSEEKMAE